MFPPGNVKIKKKCMGTVNRSVLQRNKIREEIRNICEFKPIYAFCIYMGTHKCRGVLSNSCMSSNNIN